MLRPISPIASNALRPIGPRAPFTHTICPKLTSYSLFLGPIYCFYHPVLRFFCPKLGLRHIYPDSLRAIHPKLNSLYGPLYSSAPNVLRPFCHTVLYHSALLTIPYYFIIRVFSIPYYFIIRVFSIYGIVPMAYYSIISETGTQCNSREEYIPRLPCSSLVQS